MENSAFTEIAFPNDSNSSGVSWGAVIAGAFYSEIEKRLKQIEGHVSRLESIFEDYDEKPTGKKSKGMQGLIEEGDEAAKEDYEDDTKDAVLIAAAQRVEQYAKALIKTHWRHHKLGQISLGSFPENYW